jgi:hypothetical protein
MVDGYPPDRERRSVPEWLPWLQLGISAMLVVLFVMVLIKGREQNEKLETLKARVQGLENSRALDRAPALEEQMRSLTGRLQNLETGESRVEILGDQLQRLEAELLELQERIGTGSTRTLPPVIPGRNPSPSSPGPPPPGGEPLRPADPEAP